MRRIYPFLVLARPANIITAITDILAGAAIAGAFSSETAFGNLSVVLLICSTIGLYGGGIVLNDYLDRDLDRTERPNRPIPSGQVSPRHALIFAISLSLLGILCATFVSFFSGIIAIIIAILAGLYDKYGKHHSVLGPINMGLCRGLNLLLGMSISTFASLGTLRLISLLPIVFVAAITLTSRGEVHGNNRLSIMMAITMDLVVASLLFALALLGIMKLQFAAPFLILWLGMNLYAKGRAILDNISPRIMNAVKIGVLSIIPLNAIYVAGFSNWYYGIAVLMLLPLALLLARRFSVT